MLSGLPETLPTPLGMLSGLPETLPTPLGTLSGLPETLPTPLGTLSGIPETLPTPLGGYASVSLAEGLRSGGLFSHGDWLLRFTQVPVPVTTLILE